MEITHWIWIAIAGLGLVSILFFSRQMKTLFGIARNAVMGTLGIWIFNILLASTGVFVGINILTIFIVSVLGIPGFLLLYLAQWMVG